MITVKTKDNPPPVKRNWYSIAEMVIATTMWNSGYSSGYIGKKLNRERGAICALIMRLRKRNDPRFPVTRPFDERFSHHTPRPRRLA